MSKATKKKKEEDSQSTMENWRVLYTPFFSLDGTTSLDATAKNGKNNKQIL